MNRVMRNYSECYCSFGNVRGDFEKIRLYMLNMLDIIV